MNLISVDFAKAFNSMEHQSCLRQFASHGASKQSVRLIYSFLSDRRMSYSVNRALSDPRTVPGGSPQGTLLGNFLFVIATDNLEDDNGLNHMEASALSPTFLSVDSPSSSSEPEDTDVSLFATPSANIMCNMTSTPTSRGQFVPLRRVGNASTNFEGSYSSDDEVIPFYSVKKRLRVISSSSSENGMTTLTREERLNHESEPAHWDYMPLKVWKFIDDFLAGERLALSVSQRFFSQKKPMLKLHAQECELFFNSVVKNANEIGMRVNESKTQMLCLSTSIDYDVCSFIRTPSGQKIESGDTLKILGFHFDSNPSIEHHIEQLITKVRKRSWVVRNLKKAGLDSTDLIKCYYSLIRPVLDYAVPTYHSMLTCDQSERLEKLQRDILKTIYGFKRSYEEILETENITRLSERRQSLFDSFTQKMWENGEISREWFPTKTFEHANLRRERIVIEKHARTSRLYKSPLYAMRRRLNEITPAIYE